VVRKYLQRRLDVWVIDGHGILKEQREKSQAMRRL
jgi:deoxyinosine 3'endonuclease (endonuclease V)